MGAEGRRERERKLKFSARPPIPFSSSRVYNTQMDSTPSASILRLATTQESSPATDFDQLTTPSNGKPWLGRPAGLPTDGRLQDGRGRVRYTHDAMIDQLIARPEMSQGELATMFGFTQAWISIIVNSDAFKKRMTERKATLVDPMISATVNDRLLAVTNRSLEVLAEKLSLPTASIDPDLALKAAALGVRSLVPQQSQTVQVNVDLASLAENMLKMQKGAQQMAQEDEGEGEVVSDQ